TINARRLPSRRSPGSGPGLRARSIRPRQTLLLAGIDLLPGVVGIERRHAGGDLRGALPEVLLVNRAVMVDDEGHHARIAVPGGPGDKREAADHLAFHHVVEHAALSGRSLSGEDLVVVAVERRALAAAARPVTLRVRRRHEVAERALLLAGRSRP